MLAGFVLLLNASPLLAGNLELFSRSITSAGLSFTNLASTLEKPISFAYGSASATAFSDTGQAYTYTVGFPPGNDIPKPDWPTIPRPAWPTIPKPNWPHVSHPDWPEWPTHEFPCPEPLSGFSPLWHLSPGKVEEQFETRFDEWSGQLDDLIANTPNYLESAEYQRLVEKVEKLVEKHGQFVDRFDNKIEHLTKSIDKTDDVIEHLDEVLDRLRNKAKLPPQALRQLEKQIERAQSQIQQRLDRLETKKSALVEKLEQFGMFQAEMEEYLDNLRNSTTTPSTTSLAAAEPVASSLAVSFHETAAQATAWPRFSAARLSESPSTNETAISNFSSSSSTAAPNSSASSQNSQATSSATSTTPTSVASIFQPSSLVAPTLHGPSVGEAVGELDLLPPISALALFTAGENVFQTVAGGAGEIGGVDVLFESQSGGAFTSDYFQVSTPLALVQSIGQTAFDKINFLLSDDLQGWELHFHGDFAGSALVTLGYDDSLLPLGVNEADLKIMHFDSLKGFWELPEGFLIDTEANQIRFSVTSFSPFLLTYDLYVNSSTNPEPSTGAIFGLGLLLVACRRRKARKLARHVHANFRTRESFVPREGDSSFPRGFRYRTTPEEFVKIACRLRSVVDIERWPIFRRRDPLAAC